MLAYAKWYVSKAEVGGKYSNENDNKNSMSVLKEINKRLNEEYKHYKKTIVTNVLKDNEIAKNYIDDVASCLVKQNNKNPLVP